MEQHLHAHAMLASTSATCSHLEIAAKIISFGSNLLAVGEYGASITILAEGVTLLSRLIAFGKGQNNDEGHNLIDCKWIFVDAYAKETKQSYRILHDELENNDTEHLKAATIKGASTGLVYSEPVCLEDIHAVKGAPAILVKEQVSAVALFNLALAHHLFAINESSKFNRNREFHDLIEKSLALYDMAESLLAMIEVNSLLWPAADTVNRGGLIQMAMALTNNVGAIHLETGDHSLGRKYFDRLRSIISSQRHDYTSMCHSSDSNGGLGADQQKYQDILAFFEMNVLATYQRNGAAAA